MTDRDKLSEHLERLCIIRGLAYVEHERSISAGPVKYVFTEGGEIKSIIRGGHSYGPDGERKYFPPKRIAANNADVYGAIKEAKA